MISAQTLRVCREGKPVPTFPDHALEARHALGGEITEQQAGAEQQHQSRSTEFHAAHDQRAAAFAATAQALRLVAPRAYDDCVY
jgi:hypothetical protein